MYPLPSDDSHPEEEALACGEKERLTKVDRSSFNGWHVMTGRRKKEVK
jgi:hypothetical protein